MKGGLTLSVQVKRVSNVFPLMYILWESFFEKEMVKVFKRTLNFISSLMCSNEIDSSHSNLELIMEAAGKHLRFKASLLPEGRETNLSTASTLSQALVSSLKESESNCSPFYV